MIILGIDPGTILTGYGIINVIGKNIFYKNSGIIKPNSNHNISEKLKLIYTNLQNLIKKYHPDVFCIETAFYGKNVQSALKIGYVRGVAMLAASVNGILTIEYSPREIKKAVVGNGAASKEQVQYMVKNILNLQKDIKKLDETDALAAAICYSFKVNSLSSSSKDWKTFIDKHPERILNN